MKLFFLVAAVAESSYTLPDRDLMGGVCPTDLYQLTQAQSGIHPDRLHGWVNINFDRINHPSYAPGGNYDLNCYIDFAHRCYDGVALEFEEMNISTPPQPGQMADPSLTAEIGFEWRQRSNVMGQSNWLSGRYGTSYRHKFTISLA